VAWVAAPFQPVPGPSTRERRPGVGCCRILAWYAFVQGAPVALAAWLIFSSAAVRRPAPA